MLRKLMLLALLSSLQLGSTTHGEEINDDLDTRSAPGYGGNPYYGNQRPAQMQYERKPNDYLNRASLQSNLFNPAYTQSNVEYPNAQIEEDSKQESFKPNPTKPPSIQSNLTYVQSDDCSHTYTCGNSGGWRRVVYLDMTNRQQTCPFGWMERPSPRTCVRPGDDLTNSAFFSITGGEYSKVCGRVRGFQVATTDAFGEVSGLSGIDEAYVDGVSITHGSSPRNHIFSLASGYSEFDEATVVCPCDNEAGNLPPAFVGDDYFCESGRNTNNNNGNSLYDDPLWDGSNCRSCSTCCDSDRSNYFVKALGASTTDFIEVRIMLDQARGDEDLAVELVELYVK